eukprot:augustus_masked-scaffold_2-processed-gene-11.36-mRNA-1 protein AED:0.12 eAED:0.12 QI:0/-1/0/1/-1/1/1/0/483
MRSPGDEGDSFTFGNNAIEIDLDFKVNEQLESPVISYEISAFGIIMEREERNLCRETDVVCPLVKGEEVSTKFLHLLHNDFDTALPVEVKVSIYDGKDEKSCVKKDLESQSLLTKLNLVNLRNPVDNLLDKDAVKYLFREWIEQYGDEIYLPKPKHHHYGLGSTVESRLGVFKENLLKILSHNLSQQGYKMKMNQFGHLTSEEFKQIYASGLRKELKKSKTSSFTASEKSFFRFPTATDEKSRVQTRPKKKKTVQVPDTVNWVTKGAVTPVKNQGACGSCWSFATTGALEGAYYVKYGKLVSFSEQELVSCDHSDMGCQGGIMDNAYEYIESVHGLCTEESFPYTSGEGERGFCNVTCDIVPNSSPKSFVDVDHTDVSLLEAVAQQPVAVAIEADQSAFQFYSSGVLTAVCSQELDHGVLAVGYGSEMVENEFGEQVDTPYWLVKNSWGPEWGLEGYIKIERGVYEDEGGECGILLSPSYPVM